MTPESLAQRCRDIAGLTESAGAWLGDDKNADLIGRDRDSIARAVNRAQLHARRLEKAALRPMCVGVFGPSQAGKSYLVEVLARPANGPLRARFEGLEPVDFLSQINPIGEKEATGLVTRFTVRPATVPAPAGFPVRLRLLSEFDVIKILGNTFFFDGDQTKETVPTPEIFAETFNGLARRASQSSGLSEDDVMDLQEYFQKHFAGSLLIDALGGFWIKARELAPKLDLEGRAELFSFLWGCHAPFTALYKELARAVVALGRPDEAFCPIAALVPREGSILDVATLAGLGQKTTDVLEVRTAQGAAATLPRALVTALTAELRIECTERPRPFFDETDLLDFPGARSRQKIHLQGFFAEKADALKEMFLRGKVAYLFDRYVGEQELTCMLLCIRPSNQEVVTLPDMVDEWIKSTHGRTPEARAGQRNLLFFVLTWFDTHFVDKAGDAQHEPGLRFRNRMEASLLGFFGKAHGWPRKWTPDAPFKNCYWFRNPNYPAESIIRYDGRREAEFLPEKRERIAELRQGFLGLEEAHNHFLDPARAFDEALNLNDGGISYLAENLEKVVRPELKLQQIAARVEDLSGDIRRLLGRFYVSLDIEKRLEERRTAADAVFDELEGAVHGGKFGTLLRSLLIDPTDLNDALYATLHGGAGKPQAAAAAVAPASAPAPARAAPRVLRPRAAARTNGGDGAAAPNDGDREVVLARAALDNWIERLRLVPENDPLLRHVGVTSKVAKDIVDELLGLARRIKLDEQIAADLRTFLAFDKLEQSSVKAALVAASRINRLVGDLGFGRAPLDQRPAIDEGTNRRPVFDGRGMAFDGSGIGPMPKLFAEAYATDWFHAFDRVVEDNAKSEQGVTVDLVQNQRLKAILDGLGESAAA